MAQHKNMNIIIVVILLSLLNVLLLWKMEVSYVNVLFMVITVVAVYLRPEILLLLFMVATSTTTNYAHFPKVTIAEIDLYFTDVLMILAFITLALKYDFARYKNKIKNPMTYSLLLFIVLVIVAILLSSSGGDLKALTRAVASGRPLLYYLLFIPMIAFIDDEKKLQIFIKIMIILSILISVYVLFTYVAGRTIIHQWLKAAIVKRSIVSVDSGDSGMVVRQGRLRDIPGISFIIVILPIIIGLIMYNWKSRSGKLYYVALFLGIIVILVNFTRMVWVSYLFMAFVMLLITRGKGYRYFQILASVIAFFLIVSFTMLLIPKYSNARMVTFMSQRLISFFVENYSTSTAVQRIIETQAAVEELEGNILWGTGISNTLKNKRIVYKDRIFIIGEITSLHNSYLDIIFKIGIFPLLVFMVTSIIFLRRSYRLFRSTRRSYVKGLSLGLFLAYLRVMVNAVSQHYFWHMPSIPPIVLLFALNEILIHLEGKRTVEESTSTSVIRSGTDVPERVAQRSF